MEGIASTIEKATPRGETTNDDQCSNVDSCRSIDQDDWYTARMGESLDALILVCPFFKLGIRNFKKTFNYNCSLRMVSFKLWSNQYSQISILKWIVSYNFK